jgi:hypothetical protein
MTLPFLLTLSIGLEGLQAAACAPEECLRRINAIAPVREVPLTESALPGEYVGGDGLLSGRTLYVFDDGTYIYCEWADIEPETIYDKGGWSLDNGMLVFKTDPAVTWKRIGIDHRHMAVRLRPGPTTVFLVGVDDELAFAERYAPSSGDPAGYVRFIGFTQKRALKSSDTAGIRTRLMKEAWRPDYLSK